MNGQSTVSVTVDPSRAVTEPAASEQSDAVVAAIEAERDVTIATIHADTAIAMSDIERNNEWRVSTENAITILQSQVMTLSEQIHDLTEAMAETAGLIRQSHLATAPDQAPDQTPETMEPSEKADGLPENREEQKAAEQRKRRRWL